MKGTLFDIKGKKKGEIDMPMLFKERVREDLVKKWLRVDKAVQPYSPDIKAGRKHSASGTISHKRHDWKGHYGRGIARLPRKTMWRRGTQFFWIGAEISGTRGGRRAHGPKGIGKEKKINKKEIIIAMNSAMASTGKKEYVQNRYANLDKLNFGVPVVIESKLDNVKTKELHSVFKEIFGDIFDNLILRNKKVRAGKGKLRNRKYKNNAGLLFIKGKDEKIKNKRIVVKSVNDVTISDFFPLGRLTVYTEKALEELNKEEKK